MSPKRRIKDLKRKEAFRAPNKAELIVCEGSRTEPEYLNALRRKLRLTAVWIDVLGLEEESDPVDVIRHAASRKKQGASTELPYEKVWCVVDVEVPPRKRSLRTAAKQAHAEGIELIMSNPCIEYWFLLHFRKHIKPFASDTELQQALRHEHPTYRKNQIGFDVLYPRTGNAIQNAEELIMKLGFGADLVVSNPSTNVHQLVKHLHDAAQKAIPSKR